MPTGQKGVKLQTIRSLLRLWAPQRRLSDADYIRDIDPPIEPGGRITQNMEFERDRIVAYHKPRIGWIKKPLL
eukprot:2833075-Pyramimonas_sp.AAC.1